MAWGNYDWERLENVRAYRVCGGADGSIWHVGRDGKLWHWNGAGWDHGPDDGVNAMFGVAVDRSGAPLHIGDNHIPYRWNGQIWQPMGPPDSRATRISCGGNAVWIIGLGRELWSWDGARWQPDNRTGDAVRLAVQSDGSPWYLHENGQIYHLETGNWVTHPGPAVGIAAGSDGSVVQTSGVQYWRWAGDRWVVTKFNGDAVPYEIAVGSDGFLWAVHDTNLYRHKIAA